MALKIGDSESRTKRFIRVRFESRVSKVALSIHRMRLLIFCVSRCGISGNPKGPKIEKIQDLEIFKRHWNFQVCHPPNPYFCGEFWRSGLKISSEIENFKRDWFFSRFGPLGNSRPRDSGNRAVRGSRCCAATARILGRLPTDWCGDALVSTYERGEPRSLR